MIALLWIPDWFWHPLRIGNGYDFWSGFGSDLGEVTLIAAVIIWVRSRNCHVHRCPRLSWHPHPDHGHPVCRHHHPDHKQIRAGQPTVL